MLITCVKSLRETPNKDVSYKIFLFDLTLLKHSKLQKLVLMVLFVYILVGKSYWSFPRDQLLFAKLLLCFLQLHVIICVSIQTLYIGILTMLCFFFNLSHCIFNKNLPLSCFVLSTMLYLAHYFTIGIVFSMCVGYKSGRKIIQDDVMLCLESFQMSVLEIYVNSIMRVLGGFM